MKLVTSDEVPKKFEAADWPPEAEARPHARGTRGVASASPLFVRRRATG